MIFLWPTLAHWEIRIHHNNSPGIFLKVSYITFIKERLMFRNWEHLKNIFFPP